MTALLILSSNNVAADDTTHRASESQDREREREVPISRLVTLTPERDQVRENQRRTPLRKYHLIHQLCENCSS